MTVCSSDETNGKAIQLLKKYHDIFEEQRINGRKFFNGCQERAVKLLEDLKSIGIDGLIIVINSRSNLAHESGAHNGYHHVVLTSDYQVFDPSYSGIRPIPLSEYIPTVYQYPENILIWKKGDSSNPIASYNLKFHL